MAKNYYLILGLSTNASDDDIKSAYRQQAKELHPDHSGKNHEPFLEVQEAYAVLSDPVRRQAYDKRALQKRSQRSTSTGRVEEVTPKRSRVEEIRPRSQVDLGTTSLARSFQTFSPSFDEIFDRLWSNFSRRNRPKSGRMESLTVEIPLTQVQAFHGGHVRVMIPLQGECPTCRGRGGVGPFECLRCQGQGTIAGETPVSVSFPAGISDNEVVQIPLDHLGIENLYLSVRFRVTEMV